MTLQSTVAMTVTAKAEGEGRSEVAFRAPPQEGPEQDVRVGVDGVARGEIADRRQA